MFNAKRIEDIRNRIQTSTLLTDHEKADWLNLLELMNDKQLTELEEILDSKIQANAIIPPQPSAPLSPQPMPVPEPVSPENVKEAVKDGVQEILTEEIPAPESVANITAPQPAPAPIPHTSAMPPLSHLANIPSGLENSGTAGSINTSTPEGIEPPLAPAPVSHTKEHGTQVFLLDRYENLANLNIGSLRAHDWESITRQVKRVTQEHGYFKVLHLIEASPLFSTYIKSGLMRLNGQESEMTQEEFEFMADLLNHMRINRW